MSVTDTKGYREVIVAPLAAGREALGLAAAICLIMLFAGLRFAQVTPEPTDSEKKAYQIQDLRLRNQAPQLYRSLLAAVDDITWNYEADGAWPDVPSLQQEILPPFVGNFLPIGLRNFAWKMHRGTTWVDYYGVNKDAAQADKEGADPLENSFILRIIDLQAGKYPYPHIRQENQENRFSAQIWINQQTVDYPADSLAERGWKWIISGDAGSNGNIVEPADR